MLFLCVWNTGSAKTITTIGALLMTLCYPKYPMKFYIFFGLFWPLMEMVIIHYAHGKTWVYTQPDLYNIPLYIFPLWAVVSECVMDIGKWILS